MGAVDWFKRELKREVTNIYAQAKVDANTKKLEMDYIGGLPGYKKRKLLLSMYEGQLSVNKQPARFLNLEWKEQHERSAGKAAAGAIIGGVLTGGIGAIAGAAIGGSKKDSSVAVLTVEMGDLVHAIYVRCSESEFRKLSRFL